MKNVFDIRKKTVESSIGVGVSETARIYGTTRKTVRKWLNRYKRYGISDLEDLSRAPKSSPLKISKERCFISFGYEKSGTNTGIFTLYICNHLRNMGVDLSKVVFQSDNGRL